MMTTKTTLAELRAEVEERWRQVSQTEARAIAEHRGGLEIATHAAKANLEWFLERIAAKEKAEGT